MKVSKTSLEYERLLAQNQLLRSALYELFVVCGKDDDLSGIYKELIIAGEVLNSVPKITQGVNYITLVEARRRGYKI